MSTTSNGAFSPVVRRMMPRGSVASAESAGGVVQPFTHVLEDFPRVAGGSFGNAGCVGDGTASDVGVGSEDAAAADGDPDGAVAAEMPTVASAPQATSRNAAASDATSGTQDRRMDVTIPWRDPPKDTVAPSVW
jgi:hypothetical protein